jgi:hypothetical protein
MIDILNTVECKNDHFKNRYIKIVQFLQKRKIIPDVIELHHILPECLFPEYSDFKVYPENRLQVTPREHFILHWILSKAYGGKLLYAYNMMANSFSKTHSRSYFISRSMYENLRREMILNNPSKTDEVKLKISQKAKTRWKNKEFKDKQLKRLSSYDNRNMIFNQWKDFYTVEDNKIKRSIVQRETWKNELYRNKVLERLKKYWSEEENRQKMSELMKEVWKDEELRKKQSERNSGENNPFFGRKHTKETIEAIKLKNTGRKASEETKIKLSEALKGKKRSKETKEKIRLYREGTTQKDATKEKISKKAKERSKDPEYIKKMSDAQKNRKRGICIHCDKEMDICNLKRYHNENCKKKLD